MVKKATNPLEDLLAFSGQLGLHKSSEEMIEQVITTALQTTGSTFGCIMIFEKSTGMLRAKRCLGAGAAPIQGDPVDDIRFMLDEVFASDRPIVEDRIPSGEHGDGVDGPVMMLPMRAAGHKIGVLYLRAEPGARPYDQAELAIATALANQIGLYLACKQLKVAGTGIESSGQDYLSLVTHELRIPLTSIAGYTDLILSGLVGSLTDRQEEFLKRVKRNTNRMSDLIDNLAEINRIETGKKTYEYGQFDIVEVAKAVVEDTRPLAELRQQTIEIDIINEPVDVTTDRAIASRIFADLLANASRYSPDGGKITVRVNRREDLVEVAVIDNGIGISEADQAELFRPFFRSEDPAVREQDGWGLSLALAKLQVEALGGHIHCQSRPDYGSTFLVTLPLAEPVTGSLSTDS